jgi:hypothetical protein
MARRQQSVVHCGATGVALTTVLLWAVGCGTYHVALPRVCCGAGPVIRCCAFAVDSCLAFADDVVWRCFATGYSDVTHCDSAVLHVALLLSAVAWLALPLWHSHSVACSVVAFGRCKLLPCSKSAVADNDAVRCNNKDRACKFVRLCIMCESACTHSTKQLSIYYSLTQLAVMH